MFIVAAAATAEPETAEASTAAVVAAVAEAGPSSTSMADAAAAPAAERPRGSSKWVIDEKEVLHSTWEHRAWTYGCMTLLGASLAVAASHVEDVQDAGVFAGAVFAAYVLSDLGTAVFHHAVDNYGELTARPPSVALSLPHTGGFCVDDRHNTHVAGCGANAGSRQAGRLNPQLSGAAGGRRALLFFCPNWVMAPACMQCAVLVWTM